MDTPADTLDRAFPPEQCDDSANLQLTAFPLAAVTSQQMSYAYGLAYWHALHAMEQAT